MSAAPGARMRDQYKSYIRKLLYKLQYQTFSGSSILLECQVHIHTYDSPVVPVPAKDMQKKR